MLPEKDISTHQEAKDKKTYSEDGAKLHLSRHCLLEVTPRSLSTMTVDTTMATVRVGRVDSNVGVGLRAVVDGRGSRGHCDERSML